MTFTPTLLIGIGGHEHYFTLRCTHEHYVPSPGPMGNAVVNGVYQGSVEIRSHHICNLSQDPAEALAKATEYSAQMCIVLEKVTVEALGSRLAAIHRATAEQKAARAAREKETQALYEQLKAEREAARRADVDAGVWPFGRLSGKPFEEAGPSLIRWYISKREEFAEGSLLRYLADALFASFPHLMEPDFELKLHVGTIGKRETFEVEVMKVRSFDSMFGTTYIVIMRDANKACIVSKGSFRAKEGDKLTIKATVKTHDFYNDQAQTIVQRVTVQ